MLPDGVGQNGRPAVCEVITALKLIRRREYERKLFKLRSSIQLKLLNWSDNEVDVVNNIKPVINELNDFLNCLPPSVFDKKVSK